MKVSIQKIHDKGSGDQNEDELLIKENLFAVFDGATSLVKFVNSEGKSGGKLAAEICKDVFSNNGGSLKQIASDANAALLEEMKRHRIDVTKKESLWNTAMAAVKLLNSGIEFLTIADCLILSVFKDDTSKLVVPYNDIDLETMRKWKELADKQTENIWDKIKPQTDKVRRGVNVNYGVLNGEEKAIKFVKTGKISIDNVKSIIIFTDGLLIPKENPDETENWNLFIRLYQESGPKGILKHVRSLETKDPKCWKYPRFKQHDDIAAIGIDFS
ncbi:MAG: protein phosphatase 2C domain-containing protein [Candidatus Aenigmatarchaeota archaeon]